MLDQGILISAVTSAVARLAQGRTILALDLAGVVGWAVGAPELLDQARHGSLALPKDVNAGRQFGIFSNWLADAITTYEPTDLVIEAPFLYARNESIRAVRKLFGLAAIAELIAWRRDLRYAEYAVSSVRKTFCGSGREDKAAVMAECKKRGFQPTDNNAADAVALLHHAAAVRA